MTIPPPPLPVTSAVATITWRFADKAQSIKLKDGRYLIGNSNHCHIRIKEKAESTICAVITVNDDNIILRYVNPSIPLRIQGKLQEQGAEFEIAEEMSFVIGRYSFEVLRILGEGEPEQVEIQNNPDEFLSNALSLRRYLNKKLLEKLNVSGMNLNKIHSQETRQHIEIILKGIVQEEEFPADLAFDLNEIQIQVLDEVIGLGPLESLLADDDVTEIMVNNPSQIYIEKGGKLVTSPVTFSSEQALLAVIERIVSQVGRRVDASSPIVDARLLDGSRVNAIIPPISLKGPCLTIRRFSKTPISVDQLVKWDSMKQIMADFLRICVHSHLNIVVSGGTGSGKTTLLNALSSFIPESERIVTVEDAAELQLQQPHVISLETRPANLEGRGAISIRDLVKNCLRMRPDRIVVGECRGGEALDMLQAMNTGHDGSLTTAHANTPEDMLRRLETMVLMAGVDFPLKAIREQVASAVHMIVQQTRLPSGRRLVTDISWIHSLDHDTGEYVVYPLFAFEIEENSDAGAYNIIHKNIKQFAKDFNISQTIQDLFAAYKSKGEI
ncbi:MAG: CpaF family protein [Pseudobacteriovorax sp.]|nr:CpaF family protein [Pseudobacteriovorax sp.]